MPGDLGLTLSNALSGLRVNQQQLSVLSQNIANANTQGYSRQSATQVAVSLNGESEGVTLTNVSRTVDAYLAKSVQQQTSTVGFSGVTNDYNSRIQLLMGTPGDDNSMGSYVNNFFNAVESAAQSPQSTSLQQNAVNSATTLTSQVQGLATGVQGLQYQADQDIAQAVRSVNNDLTNLQKINTSIINDKSQGRSTAGLEDQRDGLVNDIAQYINVNTLVNNDGSVSLTTGNGVSILDNNTHLLSYSQAGSAASFNDGTFLSPITITTLDNNGNVLGTPVQAVSSGIPSQVTSIFTGGKLTGLLTMRDKTLPNMMNQLDMMSSTLRDQFNALHNTGSNYPGNTSLTGSSLVSAGDSNVWSGDVRIAALNTQGQPISSPYPDEPYGVKPFNLDLSSLNTGQGAGQPTVQGIIDAVNQHFKVPQNKVEVGNLNNVQLVSATKTLPAVPANFSFGLDLDSLSSTSSNLYVSGVQVKDSSGADITSVTSTIPSVSLASAGTYTTHAGSSVVSVKTSGVNNLTEGETVYLSTPPNGPDSGGTYNGIAASNLGGYFKISNVTATGFDITAATSAVSGQAYAVASQTAKPPYSTVAAGQEVQTNGQGLITANLSANTSSPYYTVTVNVGVDDGTGNIKTSSISYRVNNNQTNLLNSLVAAQSATGDGTIVAPSSATTPLVTATLVDANGNELPKTNGVYTNTQQGYLKIQAGNSSNTIAIDSLNSKELGQPSVTPAIAATNQGFSQYFGLNNFFATNTATPGDAVTGSALNFAVTKRLQATPALLSLGQLSPGSQSVLTAAPPNYTYQLNAGDNSIIQKMAGLANTSTSFAAAGGLPATVQNFSSYVGQIIGSSATNAATAKNTSTNDQTLLDGFTQQASSSSGVNLDTELANTVIYQNAYAASARMISVVNDLFDKLLQTAS